MTLFSLELHVRTRRDARPDPEFDPICAIFYFIQTDTPQPNGKNKITGVICVDSESTNVAPSGIGINFFLVNNNAIPETHRTTVQEVVSSTPARSTLEGI